jgi:hypothetical protein
MEFDKLHIGGDLPIKKSHVIFFSCDPAYWAEHGQYLARSTLSLNKKNLIHIHVHMIYEHNQTHNLENLIRDENITYTYETHSEGFYDQFQLAKDHPKFSRGPEICNTKSDDELKRKIYLSSARFFYFDRFFEKFQHVVQLDSDGIARERIPLHEFKLISSWPAAMRKPKDPSVYIASCVTPGIGEPGDKFKKELSQNMIEAFKKPIYWFVDQHVLKKLLDAREFVSIPYKWNSWGLKSGGEIFSTAKGNKKYGFRYKALKYAWFDDKDKLKFHKNMSDKIQLEKMQQKMAKKNRKNDKS